MWTKNPSPGPRGERARMTKNIRLCSSFLAPGGRVNGTTQFRNSQTQPQTPPPEFIRQTKKEIQDPLRVKGNLSNIDGPERINSDREIRRNNRSGIFSVRTGCLSRKTGGRLQIAIEVFFGSTPHQLWCSFQRTGTYLWVWVVSLPSASHDSVSMQPKDTLGTRASSSWFNIGPN